MKKLVLMLAVAFSVSLYSCGGENKEVAAVEEAPVAEEVVAPVDSAAVVAETPADSVAAPVEAAK